MTLLYPMKPEAVGTYACEGLVSYLCRLADAHTVAVDDLVNNVLNTVSSTDFGIWRHFSFWNRSNAVSLYAVARTTQLAEALSGGTGVSDVNRLSLASIAGVLDLAGMAATELRHCPVCYSESPYPEAFRPLLWDLRAVTVCPKHLCRLRPSRCGASPSERHGLWSRRQVAGACATCGALGYSCQRGPWDREVSENDIWIASQSGALIAAVSAGEQFDAATVQHAILDLATSIGGGFPYRAARRCNFSKARLFDWINGRRRIKYAPLLAMCAMAGADLVDTMRGQTSSSRGCGYRYEPGTKTTNCTPPEKRAQILVEMSTLDSRPSLAQVARDLGVDRTTLKRGYPKESSLIIQRHLERVKAARLARGLETRIALEAVDEALGRVGKELTVRNVWLEGRMLVTTKSRFSQPFRQLRERRVADFTSSACETKSDEQLHSPQAAVDPVVSSDALRSRGYAVRKR